MGGSGRGDGGGYGRGNGGGGGGGLGRAMAAHGTLIKTEYWDRAGGGRNIRYEW